MAHLSIPRSLKSGRRRPGLICVAFLLAISPVAFVFSLAPAWSVEAAASADSSKFSIQPATGSVYYVDADSTATLPTGLSWNEAFTDLQEALAIASDGDQIWVAEGVYVPTQRCEPEDARSATFELVPEVSLYGGFDPDQGVTEFDQRDWKVYASVLSGDLDGDDGSLPDSQGEVRDRTFVSLEGIVGDHVYHVVRSENLSETARLDGFTIRSG